MEMSAMEKIKIILARKEMSLGDLAERTGQTRQNLSNKIKRNNLTEQEMRKMAEVLGCTVNIQFIDSDGTVIL